MRILVLYAHPVETSFVGGLHAALVETLRAGGHAVDDCDLYAENFDPVMSRQERLDYHDTAVNRRLVDDHARRLQAAEALVLVHPVWNYGFPAILKGYVDRVLIPGVAFDLDAKGNLAFRLRHVRKLAAVCTYGGDRLRTYLAGDPPKRFFRRALRVQMARGVDCDYLALHDMNHTTAARRAAFVAKVQRRFSEWD
jgi:NAD(P)H dehydrogenase (quinone)